MSDTDVFKGAARPTWGWALFGASLGLSASLDLSESLSLRFQPAYFLPLLTAWVAYAHGWRVLYVLLAPALPALVSVSWSVTDALRVFFGMWTDAYLLGIGAAVAFAGLQSAAVTRLLQPWWRASLWIALALLWLPATLAPEFEPAAVASNLSRIAVLLLLAVAAATLHWREVASARSSLPAIVASVLGVALLSLLAPSLEFESDSPWHFQIHGLLANEVLLALGFLVAAWGVLDWRKLALLFAALTGATYLSREWLSLERIQLLAPIAAVVLGAALSPFWRTRGAERPSVSRSARFLLVLVSLQVLEYPGAYDGFVIGGTAFLGGLVWRLRSLVAMPLVLQLAHTLSCLRADEGVEYLPTSLAPIGAVAFFFAFFGLLSNRFAGERQLAAPARALEAAT